MISTAHRHLASASDGIKTGDGTGVGFFIPLDATLAAKFPDLGAEDLSKPHVTFLYVGNVPKDRESELVAVANGVFQGWIRGSVTGQLTDMEYFEQPSKDRRVAVMQLRFSHDMSGLRWRLRDALQEAGFVVDDSFPLIWRPHTTWAYLDGLNATFEGQLPQGSWDFNGIEVWGMSKLYTAHFDKASRTASVVARHIDAMHHEVSVGLMKFLSAVATHLGVAKNVYVVGGAVRNFVIGQPIKDIDVVIDSVALQGKDSEWFAKELQRVIPTHTNLTTNNYGVAILTISGDWEVGGQNMKGEVIEIANARTESYAPDTYKPEDVAPATIVDDTYRREFTFNTLLWRMHDLADGPDKAEILDLTGCGLRDLKDGIMRCPSNPDKTFGDDPSRIIRAIKFLLKYGFRIGPDVEASIKRNKEKIRNIPGGHLSNMLITLFYETGVGKRALLELDKLGILEVIRSIATTDKPFREALANWAERKADVAFLFDLMDLGMPVGKSLGFLNPAQKDRVREITVDMTADEGATFIAVLEQPGKVIDMPGLIQEFGLKGPQIRDLMVAARLAVLDDPVLVASPRRWESRIRTEMAPQGKSAKTFTLNPGDPVLFGKWKNKHGGLTNGVCYDTSAVGGAACLQEFVPWQDVQNPIWQKGGAEHTITPIVSMEIPITLLGSLNLDIVSGMDVRNPQEYLGDVNRIMRNGVENQGILLDGAGVPLKDATTPMTHGGSAKTTIIGGNATATHIGKYDSTKDLEASIPMDTELCGGIGSPSSNIAMSWNNISGGSYFRKKPSITSTEIEPTIESRISNCGALTITQGNGYQIRFDGQGRSLPSMETSILKVANRWIRSKTYTLNVGDHVLFGKFKNKRGEIRDFGISDKGDPTVTVETPSGKVQVINLFKIREPQTPAAPTTDGGLTADLAGHTPEYQRLTQEYNVMNRTAGWWAIDPLAGNGGIIPPSGGNDATWGDSPADVMDSALDKINDQFLKEWGRVATPDELEAGWNFSKGSISANMHERVASRYMQSKSSKEWLKWIVQPFEILWKHHREFVSGPVDDAMDAIFKELAPHLVKKLLEVEVHKDVEEFLRGALAGKADMPFNEDAEEEDFQAGYSWGRTHPEDLDHGTLPTWMKRQVVQESIRDFSHHITEQIVFATLKKVWHTINPVETFKAIKHAVKTHGWKMGVFIACVELFEHFVLPGLLAWLFNDPRWLAAVETPFGEIIYAVVAQFIGKIPEEVNKPTEEGHLDWYEDTFGPVRVAQRLEWTDRHMPDVGESYSWTTWGGDQYQGTVTDTDSNVLQVACTDGKTRMVEAAKYTDKKEVKKQDGGTMTVYEYSDKHIEKRNKNKAEQVEKLRGSIDKLRTQYRKDLTSDDEKTRNTALAVGLMDVTFERVGNDESAKEGHFGVTGWQKKHVTFSGGKAIIKYVGKSGVDHVKEVTDAAILKALKVALKGKKDNDLVCDGEDCSVGATDVNKYLAPFDVSAKDIRGFHANSEMHDRLKAVRSKGGKLPTDEKEREKKLKDEFKQALEETAEAVGHEPSTLRSQYLVPGLEDDFMDDGKLNNSFVKKAFDIDRALLAQFIRKGHTPKALHEAGIDHFRLACHYCGGVTQCRCRHESKMSVTGVCEACLSAKTGMARRAFVVDPLESAWGEVLATKTDGEKEDEGAERLVRPAPKDKPPRHDLHQEKVKESDPDLDTKDDDLSLNYKKVAYNIEAINKRQQKKNDKKNSPKAPPGLKAPPAPPKPAGPPPPPGGAPKPSGPDKKEEPEHKPGEWWKTDDGYAAKNMDGVSKGGFEDKEHAEAYAKGKPVEEDPADGENGQAPAADPKAHLDGLAKAMDDKDTKKINQALKSLKTDHPDMADDVDALNKEYWAVNADYGKAIRDSDRSKKPKDVEESDAAIAKAEKALKDVANKIRGLTTKPKEAPKPEESPKPEEEAPAPPTEDEDKELDKKWDGEAPKPEAPAAPAKEPEAPAEPAKEPAKPEAPAEDDAGTPPPLPEKTPKKTPPAPAPKDDAGTPPPLPTKEPTKHETPDAVPAKPAKTPKSEVIEVDPVQHLQKMVKGLSDVSKVNDAGVAKLKEALLDVMLGSEELQDQEYALDKSFDAISKALKVYKAAPKGKDRDVAKMDFDKAVRGLKKIQNVVEKALKTKQDEAITKKPLVIGGVPVSDTEKTSDQLAARGKAAMNQYSKASPEERKTMVKQLKYGLSKAKKGTDRYKELTKISEGLDAASIANGEGQMEIGEGDDRQLLTEQKSPQYLALGKALGKTGNADLLLNIDSDDPEAFYGPRGREQMREAMGKMTDPDLVTFMDAGPGMAKVLNDPKIADDVKGVLREFMKDMAIDNMTMCHSFMMASYCGPDNHPANHQIKDVAESGEIANASWQSSMDPEKVKQILGEVKPEDQAIIQKFMRGQFSLDFGKHSARIAAEVKKLVEADPEANMDAAKLAGMSAEEAKAAADKARALHKKYLAEVQEKPEFKRTPAQKMQEFLAHAEPETRERMKGKSPEEFMEIMGAIMASGSGDSATPGKTAGEAEFFRQWSFYKWPVMT